MKTLILGDTHIGAHSQDKNHHEYMAKFFVDMFKYIDDNGIKTILQLGDLFDVRKHINTWQMNFFRINFIEKVVERDLKVIVLVGNHDIYFRESVAISSVEEILIGYKNNFIFIKEPTEMILSDNMFLLVPWVCRENEKHVKAMIEAQNAKYCAGHFEFDGFELFRGQLAKTSHKHDEYKKFKTVFSGHYHHGSHKDNIIYTGTPYELTWQDSDTTKGFYTFSETEQIEFVENKHKMFIKLQIDEIDSFDQEKFASSNIKVVFDKVIDNKKREKILEKVYSTAPNSVKIVESYDLVVTEGEEKQQTYSQATPISDMIVSYVDGSALPDGLDKETIKNKLIQIYVEAINKK